MKKTKKLLGILVLMAVMLCMACPAAFASTSVDIYLNNSYVTSYSASELENDFEQQSITYSSYYCKGGGSYHYFNTAGPLLVDVLDDAGITVGNIDYIDFRDVDGNWSTGNLPMSTIYGYYYATPGGTAEPVLPVIALQCCEVGGTLSTTDCLRNFHGQIYDYWIDDTMSEWCKDLDAIYLTDN